MNDNNSGNRVQITEQRLRTLGESVGRHAEQVRVLTDYISWFRRIIGLFARRRDDPAAFPLVLREFQMVDDEMCQALTAINRRMIRRAQARRALMEPEPDELLRPAVPSEDTDTLKDSDSDSDF